MTITSSVFPLLIITHLIPAIPFLPTPLNTAQYSPHGYSHYDPDWAEDSEWGWGYYFFKGAFDALK